MTDASGAVVPGATIELIEARGGASLQLTTDSAGRYAFLSLPPGSYRLRANLPGFRTYEMHGIRLGLREARQAQVRLEVASVTETIEVSADRATTSYSTAALDEQRRYQREAEKAQREAKKEEDYRDQVGRLKQGLVGGVKPLPVVIPETGKVLTLAGSLPPARVKALLQVKAPRK